MLNCGLGVKSDSKIDNSLSDFKEGGNTELKFIEIQKENYENIDSEPAAKRKR